MNRAPWVLAGAVGLTLLVALPLSVALHGLIAAHLGHSLAGRAVANGDVYDWWQEFAAQASGLGATLQPSILGFGAVLENLGAFADNLPAASALLGAITAWLLAWSFLSGGILDRLARNRPTRAHGFFAACGRHFPRFLRLGLVALAAYAFLFGYVHERLLGALYERVTRDVTVERTAFVIRLGLYGLFAALLVACSLLFDYARIRIVVEDRRSALGGILAALRFILRHPGGTIVLYLLNAAAFAALLLLYAAAAPGAPRTGWSMLLVAAVGQTYIVARHYLKLVFYSSQTFYFQAALAHAAYTAAPAAEWPESPAAESIANAGGTAPR